MGEKIDRSAKYVVQATLDCVKLLVNYSIFATLMYYKVGLGTKIVCVKGKKIEGLVDNKGMLVLEGLMYR